MMQGDDLKALRRRMGMTQGQLAEKLGLSGTFVGLMERGEKPISDRTQLAVRALIDVGGEDVLEHGFHVAHAGPVSGWNVIFTHEGWRGLSGNRQVILYGHFREQRQAERWARALQLARRPRAQRDLHDIVNKAVARASPLPPSQ